MNQRSDSQRGENKRSDSYRSDDKRGEKKAGDGRRTQRVEKELQVLVATFLSGSYKGEIPGLLTVTQVKVPGNLRTADVFISVLNGTQEQNNLAVKVLEKRKGEIQTFIHRKLPMKHTPVLRFFIDEGMQQALRIDSILKEIDSNRKHG